MRQHDVQVAGEPGEVVGDPRRDPLRAIAMALPGIGTVGVGHLVGPARARLALVVEEVTAQLIGHEPHPRVERAGVERPGGQRLEIRRQHGKPRVEARTVRQKG